jgi:hypothetical protein
LEDIPRFLIFLIATVLGEKWGKSEIAKAFEERHQILQWWDGVCRFRRQQKADPDGIYRAVPNGLISAYLLLAYDLYILRDHAALQAKVIERLKHKDQFQGARYELFAAATCIRAGYKIEFEDESDKTKRHPEFIATHTETQQIVAVEAKSRHPPGYLGFPGEQQSVVKAGVKRLLADALAKVTAYPFVIFVDLNLPPSPEQLFEKPWYEELKKTVDQIGKPAEEGKDLFNLILFTNHPHHFATETESDPAKDTLSVFSQHPRVAVKSPEAFAAIHNAALQYGNLPNDFPEN